MKKLKSIFDTENEKMTSGAKYIIVKGPQQEKYNFKIFIYFSI